MSRSLTLPGAPQPGPSSSPKKAPEAAAGAIMAAVDIKGVGEVAVGRAVAIAGAGCRATRARLGPLVGLRVRRWALELS